MPHRVFRSLSSRVAALSVSIALLASILIGGGAFLVVRTEISQLTEQLLAASEQTVAADVANVLSTLSVNLGGLAANRVAANALADNVGRDTYLKPFFQGFTTMTGISGDIMLLDYRAKPLASAGGRSFGAADFPWLARVVDLGKPMARLEMQNGWRHLILAHPVVYANTGTTEGILAFAMPLDQLHRFGDTKGIRHWLTYDEPIGAPRQKTGDHTYARTIAMPTALAGVTITLHSDVDPSLIAAPMKSVALLILGVVALVVVLMAVAGVGLARAVSSPLRALALEAAGITTETSSEHFLPHPGDPEEVSQLSDAIRSMLGRLATAYAALEQESRALVRNAERVANVGTWRWRPRDQSMRWSDNVTEILQLPADCVPSLANLCQAVCANGPSDLSDGLEAGLERIELDGRIAGSSPRHIRLLAERRRTADGDVYDGTVMDVTPLRQAEMELRHKQAALTAILDNFPFLIWLKDPAGRLLAVNQKYADACGRGDPAELVGLTDFDVWPARLAEQYSADDDEVLRTRLRKCVEEPMEGAPERWIETYKTPVVDEHGQVWGTAGFARDISERMRIQQVLERTSAELERSNAELQQFAYIASHDLRAPLRTVSSFISLLGQHLEGRIDEEAAEYIRYAVDGARRMDRLIVGLLEYSRVGRPDAEAEGVSLAEVMEVAVTDLMVPNKDCGAVIHIAEGLPTVRGNRVELLRLFENLIGNGIKYQPPGQTAVIEVGWRPEDTEWRIWVRDNGIGIDDSDQDRVFGIFQRLVRQDEYEGTGIGLAVSKKIAEHHRGRIWIESEVGKGSTFWVALPKER